MMVLFFWPKHLDFEYISISLNNLHLAIKYTFQKAKLTQSDYSQPYQVLNILQIQVICTLIIPLKLIYIIKTQTYIITFHITMRILNIIKTLSHMILLIVFFLFLIIKRCFKYSVGASFRSICIFAHKFIFTCL